MSFANRDRPSNLLPLPDACFPFAIASMNEAADYLKAFFALINNLDAEVDEQAARTLMQKAKKALAQCSELQALLSETVPQPLVEIATKRLLQQLHYCTNPDELAAWVKERLQKIVGSLQIDEELRRLIQQIKELPKRSSDRRNLITTLITKMQASGKITACISGLSRDLYSDALSETLLWFCEHLDEYDPSRAGPITWFNCNLFYTACRIRKAHYQQLPDKFQATERDKWLQGGSDAHDSLVREAEHQTLEELYSWVQKDPTGQLRRTALSDRLDINVQVMLTAVLMHIRKLRSLNRAPAQLYDTFAEQPTDLAELFKMLAVRLKCEPEKLRRFWREQCRPAIQTFFQQSGYT